MFEPLKNPFDPAAEAGFKTGEVTGDELKQTDERAAAQGDSKIEQLRAEADENLAKWQRAQADFINYKRRAEQEIATAGTKARGSLVVEFLPILDDLQRALDNTPEQTKSDPWYEGLQAIYRKLQSTFTSAGLTEVDPRGAAFDPNFHEAVGTTPGADGLITEVLQKGYVLGDRLLRPAMVMVGDGSASGGKAANEKIDSSFSA